MKFCSYYTGLMGCAAVLGVISQTRAYCLITFTWIYRNRNGHVVLAEPVVNARGILEAEFERSFTCLWELTNLTFEFLVCALCCSNTSQSMAEVSSAVGTQLY